MIETEIEAKFALRHLADVRERLLGLGGHLIFDRTLERTERFDHPDRSLAGQGVVLRLREGLRTEITHKRPTANDLVREETSVEIVDAERGRAFLRALGYQMVARYEKFRETFQLGECLIMLDELPFGSYLEIEGPDQDSLARTASSLKLRWEARVRRSYLTLFEDLSARLTDGPTEATFEAFQDLQGDAASLLGLQYASKASRNPVSE